MRYFKLFLVGVMMLMAFAGSFFVMDRVVGGPISVVLAIGLNITFISVITGIMDGSFLYQAQTVHTEGPQDDDIWDEDESDKRMNVIAQNGNDGDHYDKIK